MTGRFRLSWLEYDFLWEELRLGRRPAVLDIGSHGRTFEERGSLRAAAWGTLASKGFGEPGCVHPELEDCLVLLARPEWEVDGRLHLSAAGPRTSVLVGAVGGRAAVGVLDAMHVTVWRVAVTGIARALVGQLPDHPAGAGASITLPAATLDACAGRAGDDSDVFGRALVGAGVGKDEARRIVEVAGRVVRFGHLGAAYTPPHGSRVRGNHVVSFYDNPLGRYLFTRRDLWVTLAPGSTAAVTRQVEELLNGLVAGRR